MANGVEKQKLATKTKDGIRALPERRARTINKFPRRRPKNSRVEKLSTASGEPSTGARSVVVNLALHDQAVASKKLSRAGETRRRCQKVLFNGHLCLKSAATQYRYDGRLDLQWSISSMCNVCKLKFKSCYYIRSDPVAPSLSIVCSSQEFDGWTDG